MPIVLRLPAKKKTIAASLISLLLFLGIAETLFVNVARANPWIIFKPATPISGTIPPIITLFSPQNNTAYASNEVHISFNVSKPQPPIPLEAGISNVKCTLDGNITAFYYCNHYNSGSPPGIPEFSYSKNQTISNGKHILSVYAAGVVLPGDLTIFWMDTNVTIFFSVGQLQLEPEPTPSTSLAPSPMPTPSPSSEPILTSSPPDSASQTPSPPSALAPETENRVEPQPTPTTLVAASAAIMATIGIGLMAYSAKSTKGKLE